MRALVILLALSGCMPATVAINGVRSIPLKEEGENWRYAFFDAATRVMARRNYTFVTSDRPAVVNTQWKGENGLVSDAPKAILSFKLQFTTTNQEARLQATVDECWRSAPFQRWDVACTDSITVSGSTAWLPDRARVIETYLTAIENDIRQEVGPIYQDLLKRGAFSAPGAAPVAGPNQPVAQDCRDAPDCALQCDAKSAPACARLAAMFENGFGVPADKKRAGEYYKRACDGGHQPSCAKR